MLNMVTVVFFLFLSSVFSISREEWNCLRLQKAQRRLGRVGCLRKGSKGILEVEIEVLGADTFPWIEGSI